MPSPGMDREQRLAALVAMGLPPELAEFQVQGEYPDAPPSRPPPAQMQRPSPSAGGMESSLSGSMPPAPPSGAPSPTGLPELDALLGGNFSSEAAGPAAPPYGHDPFTGGVTDTEGLLRSLSEDRRGRRQLFEEGIDSSAGFANAPGHVKSFLGSRFSPLDAQYVAEAAENPAAAGGDFREFMAQNQQAPGADRWRDLLRSVGEIVATQGQGVEPQPMGPMPPPPETGQDAAIYELLRNNGVNVLNQGVRAGLNPALAQAADRVLSRQYADWSSASRGAPSNQAEFVRQHLPQWR